MAFDIHVALVGDSVLWGQGLSTHHKYSHAVCERLAVGGRLQVSSCAHSGAVIEMDQSLGGLSPHPEVPLEAPTVLEQVKKVEASSTVDLVMLNGGINDVGIWRILDLFTSFEELDRLTRLGCYTRMKKLLASAAETFVKPSCRFVVTGYYPILSNQSNLMNGTGNLARLLGIFGNAHLFQMPESRVARVLIERTLRFWHQSERWIFAAAAESARELGLANRLIHIPSPFGEQNALFTKQPWLFGFGTDFRPQDDVAVERARQCALHYPRPGDIFAREMCGYASVGHPNRSGSAALAEAILEHLRI